MKEFIISQNIAALRKKTGITQEQLALALNISPQAVSKWETGTSQP
ncbi:MAG: helix-turn-helix transcriptional regulator, partial [Clostridia bacterium]|nr:helix-turn-helix transcriptional regulator [Clostridia bacterium]